MEQRTRWPTLATLQRAVCPTHNSTKTADELTARGIIDNFMEYKVLGGLKLTVLRAVSPLKFIGVNLTFELNCID